MILVMSSALRDQQILSMKVLSEQDLDPSPLRPGGPTYAMVKTMARMRLPVVRPLLLLMQQLDSVALISMAPSIPRSMTILSQGFPAPPRQVQSSGACSTTFNSLLPEDVKLSPRLETVFCGHLMPSMSSISSMSHLQLQLWL